MFRGFDGSEGCRGTSRRASATRIVAVAVVALALAGCGSTKPLTKMQLVSRANALCRDVQTKMKTVGPAKNVQGLASIAKKLAGFEQQQIESMRKLKAPSSMTSDWKQMIEGVEEVAEDAGTLSTDVQLKKDKAAGEALKQVGAVEKRLAPIVRRDGFTDCKELG